MITCFKRLGRPNPTEAARYYTLHDLQQMAMTKDTSDTANINTTKSSNKDSQPSSYVVPTTPKGPVTDRTKVNYVPKSNDPSSFQYYPDDPENPVNKYKFALKADSQYYDPCEESSKLSFQCLERNDYDRSKCQEYFDAYRECKKQWLTARRKNRQQWE